MILIDKTTLNYLQDEKLTATDLENKRNESNSIPYLDVLIDRLDVKLNKFDFTIVKVERKKQNTLLNMFRKTTTVEFDSIVIELPLSYKEMNERKLCSDEFMFRYVENHYKSHYETKCSMKRAYYSEPILLLNLIPFA